MAEEGQRFKAENRRRASVTSGLRYDQQPLAPGLPPQLLQVGEVWAQLRPGALQFVENSQVAVYLVYAGRRGHAAVDRELYIPRSWTCDADRYRAAGLDEDTVFATKPELAIRMIGRFLDAGHRVGWVAGDEVYGGNPKLRLALEKREVGYVLASDLGVLDPPGGPGVLALDTHGVRALFHVPGLVNHQHRLLVVQVLHHQGDCKVL